MYLHASQDYFFLHTRNFELGSTSHLPITFHTRNPFQTTYQHSLSTASLYINSKIPLTSYQCHQQTIFHALTKTILKAFTLLPGMSCYDLLPHNPINENIKHIPSLSPIQLRLLICTDTYFYPQKKPFTPSGNLS